MFKSLFGIKEKKVNPVKRIVHATPSGEQLRENFRVEIPEKAPEHSLKFTYKTRHFSWKILNISVGGVMITGKYLEDFFQEGGALLNANLIVPKNKLDIKFAGNFELSIQRLIISEPTPAGCTYTLGCAFTKMNTSCKNNLDKYMRMLQLQYVKVDGK